MSYVGTRLLVYTSLFPSTARPQHGIFIETRLHKLIAYGAVAARVVAPVPWFPFSHPRFGARAKMAQTPRALVREGVQVVYPRYPLIPKLGMNTAPATQAWGARAAVRSAVREFAPQLIDAHYFYPDGVAALAHARDTKLPLVISARGTDINLISSFDAPRARMLAAAREARALIAVSNALRDKMIDIGMPREKIHVLRNGIDGERFSPQDRIAARRALGIPDSAKQVIACVGNIVPEKGTDRVLNAVLTLPDVFGVFAGDGALRLQLEERARTLGAGARVKFLGSLPQTALAQVYSAADVMVLASQREGWPNVVLEAMACGTPVVASDVGAVREMITHEGVGRVVPAGNQDALNAAIIAVLKQAPDRLATRAHALGYDWASIIQAQSALYADIAAGA
jgi:glycosyltransferase involved in cell wall biosynthesis